MKVLFIGDVVGSPGRRGFAASMPELRERHAPDLVVVNGENSAGGLGITEKTAADLFEAGADAITTGNHVYRHREVYGYLDSEPRIVRPANYPQGNPGRGHTVIEKEGLRVGIVNLSGAVQLKVARSPFHTVDSILDRLAGDTDLVLVDFHAEVTSEKVAMGWHLDGRVTAVLGTHTHVPSADGRVLPGGTAYISDVGMTGSRAGVIGVKRDQALESFITQMPVRFETAEDDVWVMGAVVGTGSDGLAESFEQVLLPAPG
jgi:2',3'-cyclic-nucleotide 2'-phosphodiesterase